MPKSPARIRLAIAVAAIALGMVSFSVESRASSFSPEAALAVSRTTPEIMALVRDVAGVSKSLAGVLHLPFGVLETALFPLPGLTFANGLRGIGKGISGVVKTLSGILGLPLSAVEAVTGIVQKSAPYI